MSRSETGSVRRLRDLFVDSGKWVTRQRAIVLEVIEETQGHLHAQQVYELARARDHRINVATVYRTLALLKEHDLVVARRFDEERHHYEARGESEPYHLICSTCGQVTHFVATPLDQILRQIGRTYQFAVDRIGVEVFGICERCR